MELGDSLPRFDPDSGWLDGLEPSLERGVPVLVHFWSTGCPLCHEGAREIEAWRSKHGTQTLETIAVFQPRPEPAPVDLDEVRRDARSLMRIGHPCALDLGRDLERAFACPFSPGYFVFDASRKLRHRQMGNAELGRIGALLDRLVVKASPSREA